MDNWESENNGDDWKNMPLPLDKNELDFPNKVVVNTHSNVPFALDSWKIGKDEAQRVDTFHRNTYFSLVLGAKPYMEIYAADEYGQLTGAPTVIELGEYLE